VHVSARRTWPQRLTIAATVTVAVSCFLAAGALAAGQWVLSNRNLVVLDDDTVAQATPPPAVVVPGATTPATEPAAPGTVPDATFPVAEPDASNFLITGADNNACVDPDSPYAPAFGDRSDFGERSDTIMVWRINPSTNQVAVLSFPRDLYVDTIGGSKARINSAYRRDDPDRLRDTIFLNFGIPIDHYVQVDFCAFKRLVDGVGGVSVPFLYPARDPNTGLAVPASGGECYTFDGDHALAYVRSRYYEYEDPPGSGTWRSDGTSDLGRISRQQDFLRRTVRSILSKGAFNPGVASALFDTSKQYLTTDDRLTPSKMLEFAGVLRALDPNAIASYQIEATPQNIAGQSVLVPRINGENMQAVLAVFRGEAALAVAPEQVFETTTTTATTTTTTTTTATRSPTTTSARATTTTAAANGSTTTLPSVVAEENTLGISPPRDVTC
jgi:LCP family protein required for cell wall assembly